MKEFFELKLGNMTIDEYEQRFLELLKYVMFIKDETVKIQRYLSGLSPSIREKIQYDDPKTMEEMIRRVNAYMRSKEKILLFIRLGMTRRSLRKSRGRRETNLTFSETVVKDNHHLER
jgi:hypothetical protein